MDSKIIEDEIKRVLGDMEQSLGVKINNFVVEVEDDKGGNDFDEVFYIVMHEDDL